MPSLSFRPPQRPLPLPPVNVLDFLPVTTTTTTTSCTSVTTFTQLCTSSPASSSESIVCWAEQVQPGTPAPPTPPSASSNSVSSGKKKARRPSVSRLHLNLSVRRPSGGGIQHSQARSGSASFLNIVDTPSTGSGHHHAQARTPGSSKSFVHPSPKPANGSTYDLTHLGYTSVFVKLPNTPATPAFLTNNNTNTHMSTDTPTVNTNTSCDDTKTSPGGVKRTLNRIRSFSILRRGQQSKSAECPPPVPALPSDIPPVPPVPAMFKTSTFNQLPPSPSVAKTPSTAVANKKKALYSSKSKGKKTTLPPTLASEVMLMQFLDGGNVDEAIGRVMDGQAKAALPAGTKQSKETRTHGMVYRDEHGGIWMDRDEEMEYKHLLSTSPALSSPFSSASASTPGLSSPGHPYPSPAFGLCADWVKFESSSSSPTKENCGPMSAIDFRRRGSSFSVNAPLVKPAEEEGLYGQFIRLPPSLHVSHSSDRGRSARRPRTPGSPSKRYGMIRERSRSRVSGRPRRGTVTSISPPESSSPSSSTPSLTSTSTSSPSDQTSSATSASSSKSGKVRRRPAPLALVPPSSSFAGMARKEFLEESFAPSLPLAASQPCSSGMGSFVDVALTVVPPPRTSSLAVHAARSHAAGNESTTVVNCNGGMMKSVKKKASRMALLGGWRK